MQAFFDGEITRHLSQLTEDIRTLQTENQYLRKKLHDYKQEEEIKERDEIISNLHKHSLLIFTMSEKQLRDTFVQKHYEKCENAGNYIYNLIGTGIGTVVNIECPVCHEKEDITDYSVW